MLAVDGKLPLLPHALWGFETKETVRLVLVYLAPSFWLSHFIVQFPTSSFFRIGIVVFFALAALTPPAHIAHLHVPKEGRAT